VVGSHSSGIRATIACRGSRGSPRSGARFQQTLDREKLLDLILSRSYCAKLAPAEREPVLEAVGRLYDETADASGIRIAYVTECFRTSTKGAPR
jgi:hypothetical protein